MEATSLAVLQHTRDKYLCESGNWTKEAEARDKNGHKTAASSSSACAWCLTGGMTAASYDLESEHGWTSEKRFNAWHQAMNEVQSVLPHVPIEDTICGTIKIFMYNDLLRTNFEDISELLDKAIDKAKSSKDVLS